MSFNFEHTMKAASDSELIRIVVTNRNQYHDAAITAAEMELTKRKIPREQFGLIKQSIEEQNEIQLSKSNSPLEWYWKILSFLFPGVFQLIIAGYLKATGYDRKADEVAKWTLYGICLVLPE